ncbi:hypothetical protein CHELA20_51727 [Hyphomicrobiales bacterium]|nr:hypothetical protein CHELA41_23286 [Hyphomicrobiales bacterium]CAH1678078.1 hypothetical protein CHELA20_51727 [Hyphomicrobiales bacterium]
MHTPLGAALASLGTPHLLSPSALSTAQIGRVHAEQRQAAKRTASSKHKDFWRHGPHQ